MTKSAAPSEPWCEPTRELDNRQLLGLVRKARPTKELQRAVTVVRDISGLGLAEISAAPVVDRGVPEELSDSWASGPNVGFERSGPVLVPAPALTEEPAIAPVIEPVIELVHAKVPVRTSSALTAEPVIELHAKVPTAVASPAPTELVIELVQAKAAAVVLPKPTEPVIELVHAKVPTTAGATSPQDSAPYLASALSLAAATPRADQVAAAVSSRASSPRYPSYPEPPRHVLRFVGFLVGLGLAIAAASGVAMLAT